MVSDGEAWRQIHRALDHGFAKEGCRRLTRKFPWEIEDFANQFVVMQELRHKADYDPSTVFAKSEVEIHISTVERTMRDFRSAPLSDGRNFCAYVLFRSRPS